MKTVNLVVVQLIVLNVMTGIEEFIMPLKQLFVIMIVVILPIVLQELVIKNGNVLNVFIISVYILIHLETFNV